MATFSPTKTRSRSRIAKLNLAEGTVTAPTIGSVSAEHGGEGAQRWVILRGTGVGQSVVNGTEYQSTLLYTFPEGRLAVDGVIATIQQTTTSALAGTLNASSTGAVALGSAAASNTSLTSTMVNFLPSTAFTSSATVNVAGTAVNAALAAVTQLDGTTTAVPVYLNSAFATTGDVDADATQTFSFVIIIHYKMLGDYPAIGD